MNSQYFAQYLLNTGVLSADAVQQLLADAMSCRPDLPVLALRQHVMTAQQLDTMGELSADAFAEAVQKKGLMTASQVLNLRQAVTGESLRFAQAMLSAGIVGYQRLEELFSAYDAGTEDALHEAVVQCAGTDLEEEIEFYAEYVDVFMRSLIRFMDTPAVINKAEQPLENEEQMHFISQRLTGDLNLVAGILATDDVLVEMARRYSQEDVVEADELALDCVTEFLNVMNGLYIVSLAKRDLELDLELPRMAKNKRPLANKQLTLPVDTGFGLFYLLLAADEFL